LNLKKAITDKVTNREETKITTIMVEVKATLTKTNIQRHLRQEAEENKLQAYGEKKMLEKRISLKLLLLEITKMLKKTRMNSKRLD